MNKLSISKIANMIEQDWKNVHYAARPYLDAMKTLNSIKDNYYLDSGSSVIAYFLSNSNSWRGAVARDVKKELNRRLKEDVRS